MAWSEERLLRWLARSATPRRSVRVGAGGDDAATVELPRGARPVLCTDQTIEKVHFEPGAPPAAVGHKAAARALSDLAATAATPVGVLLALHAPRGAEERWMRAVIRAVRRTAEDCGAELLGGDLACAPGPRTLTVTALGRLAPGARPPGRDRARPGDLLLATGAFGGSGLGRHLALEPRLDEGIWLHAHGVRAMMDVSDGLALDLQRLARASGVGIDLEEVPVHADAVRLARRSGEQAIHHALVDGEDHELVATLPPAAWRRAERAARRRFPELAVVGRVRRGKGLRVRWEPDGPLETWRGPGGWLHGG